MSSSRKPSFFNTIGTLAVCLLGAWSAWGQADPAQKPLMSEEAFKDVQVRGPFCSAMKADNHQIGFRFQ